FRVAVHGSGDRDGVVGAPQDAAVAGLAAAGRVKDRPVEDDAAAVVDRQDRSLGFLQVGVVTEKQLGCHRFGTRESRRKPEDYTNGTEIVSFVSNQSGTGRSWARRNSGLNSLDW